VSTRGYVIVDDYNLPMCKKAVDDYRRANGITEELVPIDDAAAEVALIEAEALTGGHILGPPALPVPPVA